MRSKFDSLRAPIVVIAFSCAGALSFYFAPQTDLLIPQAMFFAVLTINTYFSVRLFSRIQPNTPAQWTVDALLIVASIALALSLGHIVFTVYAAALFFLSTLKYIFMLEKIPHEKLLLRKITINAEGALLCISAVITSYAGYAEVTAWVFAIVFTVANLYVLSIKPMYRLE